MPLKSVGSALADRDPDHQNHEADNSHDGEQGDGEVHVHHGAPFVPGAAGDTACEEHHSEGSEDEDRADSDRSDAEQENASAHGGADDGKENDISKG